MRGQLGQARGEPPCRPRLPSRSTDLETPALPLDRIGRARQAGRAAASPCRPACCSGPRSSSGSSFRFEPVFQLGHRNQAVEQPAAVVALNSPRVVVGSASVNSPVIASSTSRHRDHALHPRRIRRRRTRAAHLRTHEVLEQLHARQRFGARTRRGCSLSCSDNGIALHHLLQQALCRDDAEHVFEPAAAHRVARVLLVADDAQHVVGGGPQTSSQTISVRGIIIEPTCRSSSRNTLRTIWCSCASIHRRRRGLLRGWRQSPPR